MLRNWPSIDWSKVVILWGKYFSDTAEINEKMSAKNVGHCYYICLSTLLVHNVLYKVVVSFVATFKIWTDYLKIRITTLSKFVPKRSFSCHRVINDFLMTSKCIVLMNNKEQSKSCEQYSFYRNRYQGPHHTQKNYYFILKYIQTKNLFNTDMHL